MEGFSTLDMVREKIGRERSGMQYFDFLVDKTTAMGLFESCPCGVSLQGQPSLLAIDMTGVCPNVGDLVQGANFRELGWPIRTQ
jgi:hypothetical protein